MPMFSPNPSSYAADGASSDPYAEIVRRLADVHQRMAAAALRADRSPHAITLVAVSKSFDADAVLAARRAGHADFGESRAQELRRKAKEVGRGVRWHFIGRLQRNKVRDVVGTASLIHSVDRIELAEAIAERTRRQQRVQRVLVQVNVDEDPAKAGCPIGEALGLVARIRGLGGIACEGFMAIPALDGDSRAAFASLREVRDEARERFPEVQHLSMGMTHDFEVAVEEGATIVRVGEAIFGPRHPAD